MTRTVFQSTVAKVKADVIVITEVLKEGNNLLCLKVRKYSKPVDTKP